MLQSIVLLCAVAVIAILVYAATRPAHFHVERSTAIHAPPERIFPLLDDFRQWDAWSPYNKDPAMHKTYGGSPHGPGATYAWDGNRQVGKGDIAITESSPPSRIAFELHMIKPFEAHDHVVFALDAAPDTTTVTWILEGTQAYFAKLMGMFVDMDRMVGKDFETGLARLKAAAEQ